MRALVIGASGLVGRALTRSLPRFGIQVLGTFRKNPFPGGLGMDFLNPESIDAGIRSADPDLIFLAVNVPGGVDAAEADPETADAVLVRATERIARSAETRGAALIFYSSDYLFDGRSGPYGEDDPVRPINVYGLKKLEAEETIRATVREHLIVRTAAVFGWQPGTKNFAMQVWEKLRRGEPLNAPDDQWCNPTLASDLADKTLEVFRKGGRGVFNIVGRDGMFRSEMARALARSMDLDPGLVRPVPTSGLGQKAPRPLKASLKTDKLTGFLGSGPLPFARALEIFREAWRADRGA